VPSYSAYILALDTSYDPLDVHRLLPYPSLPSLHTVTVCGPDAPKYKREIGGCWDASARAPLVGRGKEGKDGNAAYDAIIGADLTYTSGLIAPLAKTLKDFSGPQTEIILCWCEPKLFTFNTDVMTELNDKGIPELQKDFKVERITEGQLINALRLLRLLLLLLESGSEPPRSSPVNCVMARGGGGGGGGVALFAIEHKVRAWGGGATRI